MTHQALYLTSGLVEIYCSVLATGIAPAFTIVIRIIYPLGEVTNNRFIQVFDAGGRISAARFFFNFFRVLKCLTSNYGR